ncbi:MAG: hypothetical protein IPG50_02255 [Myxococcales bacterium]|nr:hypothetical protein [Myxococcales bacterium]
MKTKGIALALVAGALFVACGSRSLTEDLAPALSGPMTAGPDATDVTLPASPHVIVVRKAGDLSGLVESEPPGINCGATCAAEFATGKLVLQGKDTPTARFIGWRDGATCAGGAPCTLEVARLPSVTFVTAEFAPKKKRVTVNVEGKVGTEPAGVVTGLGAPCSGTCATDVPVSDAITLTATPAVSAAFVEWQGCTKVNDDVCTVSGPQDATVTARFVSCGLSGDSRYVDHLLGRDEPRLGHGPGVCANRTLGYALRYASGDVYLAPGIYPGGVSGESQGYTLVGKQHLYGVLGDASKVVFEPTYYQGTTSVTFKGESNGVTSCTFRGSTVQGLFGIVSEPTSLSIISSKAISSTGYPWTCGSAAVSLRSCTTSFVDAAPAASNGTVLRPRARFLTTRSSTRGSP